MICLVHWRASVCSAHLRARYGRPPAAPLEVRGSLALFDRVQQGAHVFVCASLWTPQGVQNGTGGTLRMSTHRTGVAFRLSHDDLDRDAFGKSYVTVQLNHTSSDCTSVGHGICFLNTRDRLTT